MNLLSVLLTALLAAASLDAIAQIDLRLTRVTALENVVDIKHAGDGSGRLFLVQDTGAIRILKRDGLMQAPFLDLTGRTEFGQLSIAFPPDFENTGRFYLAYPDDTGNPGLSVPSNHFVSRFQVSDSNPDRADPESEETLVRIEPRFSSPNGGGKLQFGPDGMLYYAFGDGGTCCDDEGNGQDTQTLLGKILRIDVSPDTGFAIPADNPFVNDAEVLNEIWAIGLRNPRYMAFDRITGEHFVVDLGRQITEINLQPPGASGQNYGWARFDGSECFQGPCNDSGQIAFPIVEIEDMDAGPDTEVGGQVYRGLDYPALQGLYLYGDSSSGRIWGLKTDGTVDNMLLRDPAERAPGISTFGEDEVGNVYVAVTSPLSESGVFLISDGAPVAPSRPIVAAHSGTYVVDGLPDQGFFITVDENASGPFLFFAWFTFLDGEPFWLVGIEFFVEGDANVVTPVSTRRGPGFLDFSGTGVEADEIGTMSFTAESCTRFRVDYDFDQFGVGSLDLDKLTGVKGLACED
ncbi:MAG: PQQ-dependent sugar dehydrogenase [Xanthomonadales bacterium]|nr:PQQ-dependent sugar dehydrogenase [Xanthomonadales bacterium]